MIVTTTFTSGEGHVVEDGISRRVRKILAGVPASVSFRDLILALSLSRAKRQYWTVGNRPIRKNDLRSLHRNSVEAQIQSSRQKTGLNTVGFLREAQSGANLSIHKPKDRVKGTSSWGWYFTHVGMQQHLPSPVFAAAVKLPGDRAVAYLFLQHARERCELGNCRNTQPNDVIPVEKGTRVKSISFRIQPAVAHARRPDYPRLSWTPDILHRLAGAGRFWPAFNGKGDSTTAMRPAPAIPTTSAVLTSEARRTANLPVMPHTSG